MKKKKKHSPKAAKQRYLVVRLPHGPDGIDVLLLPLAGLGLELRRADMTRRVASSFPGNTHLSEVRWIAGNTVWTCAKHVEESTKDSDLYQRLCETEWEIIELMELSWLKLRALSKAVCTPELIVQRGVGGESEFMWDALADLEDERIESSRVPWAFVEQHCPPRND